MDPANANGFPTGGAPTAGASAEPTPETNPETKPGDEAATPAEETASPETTPEQKTDETTEATPTGEPAAAVELPAEVQQQLSVLTDEQKAWGPRWEIRDLARTATEAMVSGSTDEKIAALEAITGPGTFQLFQDVLVAQAAEHVAREHGISPREMARRLGAPAPVQIPRSLERAIELLPEADGKVFQQVISERDEFKRRLDDALGVVKERTGEVGTLQQTTATQAFAQEFNGFHGQAIPRLVEVPADAVESVMLVTTQRFMTDLAANKAMDAYAEAAKRGENDRVLKATYLPPVHAALEAIIKREAARFGYKTKEVAQAAGAKPKAQAGTPPKVINPTKAADAAAAGATNAPAGEKKIPSVSESVDRYLASLKKPPAAPAPQRGA